MKVGAMQCLHLYSQVAAEAGAIGVTGMTTGDGVWDGIPMERCLWGQYNQMMNTRTTNTYKPEDLIRFFNAFAVICFGWAILMGWQQPLLERPPREKVEIVSIKALTWPDIEGSDFFVGVRAQDTKGNKAWWYFPNVTTLVAGIKPTESYHVWLSLSDKPEHGGKGFIWQVAKADGGEVILGPSQVIDYRNYSNGFALFKRVLLVLFSLGMIAAARFIHRIDPHKLSRL